MNNNTFPVISNAQYSAYYVSRETDCRLTEKNLFLFICDLTHSRYIYIYILHLIYICFFTYEQNLQITSTESFK